MKAVKVPAGSDPIEHLKQTIKSLNLSGGLIVGIGGFKWAKLGIYDGRTYHVELIVAKEEKILEVAPLIGNYLITPDGEVSIHLHVTLGRDHGEVYVGHLIKAETHPFLEVFLIEAENNIAEIFNHRVGKK